VYAEFRPTDEERTPPEVAREAAGKLARLFG
jgi:hypothetical protein